MFRRYGAGARPLPTRKVQFPAGFAPVIVHLPRGKSRRGSSRARRTSEIPCQRDPRRRRLAGRATAPRLVGRDARFEVRRAGADSAVAERVAADRAAGDWRAAERAGGDWRAAAGRAGGSAGSPAISASSSDVGPTAATIGTTSALRIRVRTSPVCAGVCRVITMPLAPARPVRPERCRYALYSAGGSAWMTSSTPST